MRIVIARENEEPRHVTTIAIIRGSADGEPSAIALLVSSNTEKDIRCGECASSGSRPGVRASGKYGVNSSLGEAVS